MFLQSIILFVYATVALAAPLPASSISSIQVRQTEFIDLASRDSAVLQARAGPFAPVEKSGKKAATDFVGQASDAQIQNAAAGGSSAMTTFSDNTHHLDRQQPTSDRFKSKVAVQLNGVKKGSPSTVGQTVVQHGQNPTANKVRKKLNQSIKLGKETNIGYHPDGKKAKNIAANAKKSAEKQQRLKKSQNDGIKRAKAGQFKKGNK